MRIIWFSHRDIKHPRSGGAERMIFEVGKRLTLRGHEFSHFSVAWEGAKHQEKVENINVIRLRGNVIAHLNVPLILEKYDYDVVVDDLGHVVPWFSEHFTSKPGTAMFYHLHRRSLPGQVSLPLRMLLNGVEQAYPLVYRKWPFVVDSESAKNDLVYIGINQERISVIPLGVDLDLFKPGEKNDDPSLLYFAGFRDYKRPYDALLIFKKVLERYSTAKLYMVGSGPDLQKVSEYAYTLGLSKNTIFTGKLTGNELIKVIQKNWINLHCSTTEGFGLSIIESSACGVPTVAYSVPGVSETVENGRNGLLAKDGSVDDMASLVLQLLDSYPSGLESSSRKVAEKYPWEMTAKLWERHLLALTECK